MGTFTVPGIPLLEALSEKVGEPHGGRTTYFVRDVCLMPPTLTPVPVANCGGCNALVMGDKARVGRELEITQLLSFPGSLVAIACLC